MIRDLLADRFETARPGYTRYIRPKTRSYVRFSMRMDSWYGRCIDRSVCFDLESATVEFVSLDIDRTVGVVSYADPDFESKLFTLCSIKPRQ
jgi:hypothetical protein